MFNDTTKKYTIGSDDDLSLFKSNFDAGSGIAESSAEVTTQQPIGQKKFTIGDNTSDLEKFKSKLAEPKINKQPQKATEEQKVPVASPISQSKVQPVKEQPQIPYTDQRWQSFKVPEVKSVQQPVQQSQAKLPPNLRKVYEDELSHDAGGMSEVADIVAGTRKPMRAQPTPGVGEVIGKSILTGMAHADMSALNIPRMMHKGISNVWGAITPDFLYKKENDPLTKMLDKGVEHFEKQAEKTKESLGELKGFKNFLNTGLESLPTMVMAAVGGAGIGGGAAAGTLGQSATKLAPEIARMIPFGTIAAGGYARDAEHDGASYTQQVLYGALSGMAEMATETPVVEGVLGTISQLGAGKLIEQGSKNFISKYGKIGLAWLSNTLKEGLQEAVIEPITGTIKKMTYDKNMPIYGDGGIVDPKQMGSAFYGGVAMSVILGALGLPAYAASRKYVENRIETGKPLDSKAIEKTKSLMSQEIDDYYSMIEYLDEINRADPNYIQAEAKQLMNQDIKKVETAKENIGEKTTDLNVPTTLETNASIPNVADEAKIKPEPNIEATEDIDAKQAETEPKDDGKSKELTFEEYKALVKPDFVEDEVAWEKKALDEYNGIVKKDADKQKEMEQAGKNVTLKTFGKVEIVDDTDKSMVKVKNKNGTIIPIGRKHFENLLIGQETKGETVSSADMNKYAYNMQKHADKADIGLNVYIENSANNVKQPSYMPISKVTEEEALKVYKSTGYDVNGYTHKLSDNDIRHILKAHGNEKIETSRGQIPVSIDDIKKIPEIIANPDNIRQGSTNKENRSIIYEKRINGYISYVEVILEGHKSLQTKTMWKKPSTQAHADTSVSPSPYVRNENSQVSSSDNIIPQQFEFMNNENEEVPTGKHDELNRSEHSVVAGAPSDNNISQSIENDNIKDVEKGLKVQIESWQKGKMKPNEVFDFGKTPEILVNLGAGNKPLVMTQNAVAKIVSKHELNIENVVDLPKNIADPIMIFQSKTVPNSFVVLTEIVDNKGRSVIAAIHLDKIENRIEVNRIASAYDRNNEIKFVRDNIEEGNLLYSNSKKSDLWFTSRGLQLPKLVQTNHHSNNSILKSDENINKAKNKVQSSAITEPLTGLNPQLPTSDGSSKIEDTKTVDEIVEIIEKAIGTPIRTGKFRQRAHGIFKTVSEVIRIKVTNDLPTICHEVGHYLDKKISLDDKQFKSELMALGRPTSRASYSPEAIRAEGVAEFVRLYLTNPIEAQKKAPGFLQHFEAKLDKDSLTMLNSIRTDILKVVNLSDVDKIKASMSVGESRRSTKQDISLSGMMQRAYNAWIDEYAPFARVQRRAEGAGYQGKNIDTAVKLYRGLEGKVIGNLNLAQTDINGNIIGKSFKEIMEPIGKDEVSDFRAYMTARRATDYEARDMVMPFSYSTAHNTIAVLEQKHSHFEDAFSDIRQWEDNELQLLVDSGIMSQQTVDKIKANNPNHVPLYRIQEAVEAVHGSTGSTLGQSKKIVKKAKGSGKTIIDPLESIVTNAFIVRRAAEANRINSMLADMADNVEGFGDLVEAVPPGIKGFSFNIEEIEKQLKDMWEADTGKELDTTGVDLDKLVTLFRANYKERNNEITVYREGKPKLYQVETELYKAIKGLNREASHFLIRWLNVPKKVIQAGAVTTVRFAVWNMSRDSLGSLMQSETGINPIELLMGYKSALDKDKWFQQWALSGGATEFLMTGDRKNAQDILFDDILGYKLVDKLNEAIKEPTKENLSRLLFHPINSVRDLVGWSEAGPKVAEFRKAIEKKGLAQEEAAELSRKVNQDFLKYGYRGKELNKITGFFNANLQGDIRVGETFAKHPYRTLLRGLLYITLPTLFLYYLNDENEKYKQLQPFRKALFYNIPLGNPKTAQRFLPIPKGYGYGLIFGAIPEILLDKLRHDDPKAWKDMREAFLLNFDIPLKPSAGAPVWEILTNKSWNKTPIESVGDKNKPAYLRYNDGTSIAGKGIANILKDVPGLNKVSPKQIDYAVKGYTGSVGDFFWKLPDNIKNVADNPTDVLNYPVVRSFIVDAAYSNRSIDDFYTYGEELNMRLAEAKETGTYRAISHLPEDKQKGLVPAIKNATKEYNSVARSFSDGRKAISEIKASKDYSPTEKKMRERKVQLKMIDIADKFNKKYERFKKQNNIK